MNRLGEFYLCIPKPLELRTENQGPFIVSEEQRRTRLVSLDPGVRTFMTCYSPDGYGVMVTLEEYIAYAISMINCKVKRILLMVININDFAIN